MNLEWALQCSVVGCFMKIFCCKKKKKKKKERKKIKRKEKISSRSSSNPVGWDADKSIWLDCGEGSWVEQHAKTVSCFLPCLLT